MKLTRDGLHFYNIDEEELEKEATHIDWDMNAAEKGGYEHFMLKEMHEQPKAVKDTLTPRIKNGDVVIDANDPWKADFTIGGGAFTNNAYNVQNPNIGTSEEPDGWTGIAYTVRGTLPSTAKPNSSSSCQCQLTNNFVTSA